MRDTPLRDGAYYIFIGDCLLLYKSFIMISYGRNKSRHFLKFLEKFFICTSAIYMQHHNTGDTII